MQGGRGSVEKRGAVKRGSGQPTWVGWEREGAVVQRLRGGSCGTHSGLATHCSVTRMGVGAGKGGENAGASSGGRGLIWYSVGCGREA